MAKMSLTEKAFVQYVSYIPPSSTLAPGPGTDPTDAKTAIRRCCAAWQHAYKAFLKDVEQPDHTESIFAGNAAGRAYCNAMPLLVGENGIRDFIACAAHGILIEAIPQQRGTQLLYAAQVALNLLHIQSKKPNAPIAPPSRPAPRELPPPPSIEDSIEIGAKKRASRFE
jgi:hypothetical protein